jgi:hypothetical protein
MRSLAFWKRRLLALEYRIHQVETAEIALPAHGARRALYDARDGVRGLIEELQRTRSAA